MIEHDITVKIQYTIRGKTFNYGGPDTELSARINSPKKLNKNFACQAMMPIIYKYLASWAKKYDLDVNIFTFKITDCTVKV